MNLTTRAKVFANIAHDGQVRKYTGEPYISHPVSVAKLVKDVGSSDTVISAAWLHDVVENTKFTAEDILNRFGVEVANLVLEVTDVSEYSDGNRYVRKEIDRQHLAKASPEGKTIKLADIIDNAGSIIEYDLKFAKVYMAEKRALLEVLKDGDPVLLCKANEIVKRYEDKVRSETIFPWEWRGSYNGE